MDSPSGGRRRSLGISSSSSPKDSPKKHALMKHSLRDTISKKWPPASRNAVSMAIRADDIYRQYARAQDPEELFDKAANWITKIQTTSLDEDQTNLLNEEVHEVMIRAIFGSNMIEHAGLGYDITILLCKKVFAGEDADLKNMPSQYVLRGRNEIIQHAKAFQFIIHAFVTKKQDLTEDLIKETHRILTKEYGGTYRTIAVGAGSTNFTVPKFVPAKMREMCDDLKKELAAAQESNTVDPFSIGAKYSLQFVQIHPFQDGNGRLCRMILNAVLCRYAGIIVPIGEHAEEREEYMGIKKRASQEMEGHGEYALFVLRRSITRLREMKKKLAGKKNSGSITTGTISQSSSSKPLF
ncbi:hypothetical protein AAE478_000653 [Parahypoxylon ruwenzoriense]